MVVEKKVQIATRLAQIGQELNRLMNLPPAERAHVGKKLRLERRLLVNELKSISPTR